jgi:hypothetical protein
VHDSSACIVRDVELPSPVPEEPRAARLLAVAPMCARPSADSFGHAMIRVYRGGVAVGLVELSKALSLVGASSREAHVPGSWR